MAQLDQSPIIEHVRTRIRDSLQQISNAATATELRKVTLNVFHDVIEQLQGVAPDDDTAVNTAEEFMITHLHEGITLQTLSENLGYSPKYCSEWFRVKTGKTFSAYHTQLRVNRAELLLAHPGMPLSQIAEAVGFQDQFAFSRFFKKTTGVSPSQYRARLPTARDRKG